MNNDRVRDYTKVFSFFNDRKLGRIPTVLKRIGTVFFVIFLTGQIIVKAFGQPGTDGGFKNPFIEWAMVATAIGFTGGVLLLAIVAVYYIGSQNGMSSFVPSLLFVLKRVGLFIFLPALVFAGLIVLVAAMLQTN